MRLVARLLNSHTRRSTTPSKRPLLPRKTQRPSTDPSTDDYRCANYDCCSDNNGCSTTDSCSDDGGANDGCANHDDSSDNHCGPTSYFCADYDGCTNHHRSTARTIS